MKRLLNAFAGALCQLLLLWIAFSFSGCAKQSQNYVMAEQLYESAHYEEAYPYVRKALDENPNDQNCLKLEAKIRKGLTHNEFLGWGW